MHVIEKSTFRKFTFTFIVVVCGTLGGARAENVISENEDRTAAHSAPNRIDFTSPTFTGLPQGAVTTSVAVTESPSFHIGEVHGSRALLDTPGSGGDVLYFKTARPATSLQESFSFIYSTPESIVEPMFVEAASGQTKNFAGLQTNLSASRAGNSSAGNISSHFRDSAGNMRIVDIGRLRSEPYFYREGHVYRVDAIADASSGLLTTRVYDIALGPQSFDDHIRILGKTVKLYPGFWVHRGSVAVLDFAYGSDYELPITPHPARRASDYIDYLGYNAEIDGSLTKPASIAFQKYFPPLLIKHVRVPDEPRFLPSINAVARYGINADVLTGNATTIASLQSFITSLTLPPDAIELWNEPNNPSMGASYDPAFSTNLPKFAVRVAEAFPNMKIWGPSVLTASSGFPVDVNKLAKEVGPHITAWNAHSYTLAKPENLGYGGFFGSACGKSKKEDCGWYGAPNYNDNVSSLINPDLPGITSEGAASYGTYPDRCGHGVVDLETQQAYIQRGMLYNYKLGHLRIMPYNFIDHAGCSFGTYGLLSRRYNLSDATPLIAPKPSYVSLVYLNNILSERQSSRSSFDPKPLSYGLSGGHSDLEELLLAESDGSYRLILWSDRDLWDFNANGLRAAGSRLPLVSDSVTIHFARLMKTTAYSQVPGLGTWAQSATANGTSTRVKVNQFPVVIAITTIDKSFDLTLPSNVPTPGPTEQSAPR